MKEIVVTTPAGRCPVRLKEYDAETVMLWGDQVREIGRGDFNPPVLYSLPALLYWVKQMELDKQTLATVVGHLHEIYSDEIGMKGVQQPAIERRHGLPDYVANGMVEVKTAAVDEPDDDAPKKTATRRAKIHGHSTTAILRWMGANGFTFEQARAALAHYGDANQISDVSVTMQVNDGSSGRFRFGTLVELTPAQAAELNAHAGRAAKPAAGKKPAKAKNRL